MKKILQRIIEEKSISASALSNKLGASRGFVNSVNYRKEDQMLFKLLTIYPDLNPYFLITGQEPVSIDMKSESKLAKLGGLQADFKVLYDNLRSMYDDVVKNNRHLNEVNMKLMNQNAELIERCNPLT